MRERKIVLANAFTLTVAIFWIVCSLLIALFPAFTLTVTNWWMHGLSPANMGTWNLTWGNFLLGGLALIVLAWPSAYLFGWCWELFGGKQATSSSREGVRGHPSPQP